MLSARVDGRTCESCNEYNMVKLARRLFSFNPDGAYVDYHERALFNHVLGSIDPEDGTTSYMVPVGRGVQQEYQNMQQSFTCCVGTGMENPALHGYGVYYESPDTVWVNLFAPTTAQLTLQPARLSMETGFPDGDTATIKFSDAKPKEYTLAVRRPAWADDGFTLKVNGASVEVPTMASLRAGAAGGRALGNEDSLMPSSSYVEVKRTWKTGDVVEIAIPKSLRLEPTPDNKSVAAIMWGPLVLAGNWGPRIEGGRAQNAAPPVPVLVTNDRPVTDWVATAGNDFVAKGVAKETAQPSAGSSDVALTPFYRTHRRRYSIYFDVLTQAEFDAKVAAIAADKDRAAKLAAATIGSVQPGDPQVEQTFNYQSEPKDRPLARTNGRASRAGQGWFSFDLPVDASGPNQLVVTYFNEQGLPPALGNFDVMIDGTSIGKYEPNQTAIGFYDRFMPIPQSLTTGRGKVTVKFVAAPGSRIVPLFGVRTIRPF
jgi:hypothetical protein